jgi:hypothetical protein
MSELLRGGVWGGAKSLNQPNDLSSALLQCQCPFPIWPLVALEDSEPVY